jgi:hypothetical protein
VTDSKLGILQRLVSEATATVKRYDSTTDFEPALEQVLAFAFIHQEDPEVRSFFVQAVSNPAVAWEIVEYCMYELRWPEVLAQAKLERDAHEDWRVKSIMLDIVNAANFTVATTGHASPRKSVPTAAAGCRCTTSARFTPSTA